MAACRRDAHFYFMPCHATTLAFHYFGAGFMRPIILYTVRCAVGRSTCRQHTQAATPPDGFRDEWTSRDARASGTSLKGVSLEEASTLLLLGATFITAG